MNATSRSFIGDFFVYVGRIKQFEKVDWCVYGCWIGLMIGLLASVGGFIVFGAINGVHFPAYVWNVPVGISIFVTAIGIDTIGHRTAYKRALERGEALVHHITIFAGITSCLLLCLAFTWRDAFRLPAYAFTGLTVFYSGIDEAMHWIRYFEGNSDRIEMWSHFFIFVGHTIMMLAWCYWFELGYAGVAETVALLHP
jgi:hypothetical protein